MTTVRVQTREKRHSAKSKRMAHAFKKIERHVLIDTIDLAVFTTKELVSILLPAALKRNGKFTIIDTFRHPAIDDVLPCDTVASVVFKYTCSADGRQMNIKCRLAAIGGESEGVTFYCEEIPDICGDATNGPIAYCGGFKVNVSRDWDEFERNYDLAVHAAHLDYLPAIGQKPLWCYILFATIAHDHDRCTIDQRLRPYFGGHEKLCKSDSLGPFLKRIQSIYGNFM